MKPLIVIIILIDLFLSNTILEHHAKGKDDYSYEDLETIGGALVLNMIVLVLITFLTLIYMII